MERRFKLQLILINCNLDLISPMCFVATKQGFCQVLLKGFLMMVMSAPITARSESLHGLGVALNILGSLSMTVVLCIVPGKSLRAAALLTRFLSSLQAQNVSWSVSELHGVGGKP